MKKSAFNRKEFLKEFSSLLKKHGVYLDGQLRLRDPSDGWEIESAENFIVDEVSYHGCRDLSGPFLLCSIEREKIKSAPIKTSKLNPVIYDNDALLKEGVKSQIDGKHYFNKHDWKNHLKDNGCVEIGNDFNNAKEIPGKLRGDFDVRNDLGKATYQVAEKYGY